MANLLTFNLDDFTNEFVGSVVSSVGDMSNDGTTQIWKQIIVRERRGENGQWEYLPSSYECTQQDCQDALRKTFHHHQWIWANRTKGSELHRFMDSLDKNTSVKLTNPEDLAGFRFRWTEWDKKGYTKKDGTEVKDKPYYFPAGWAEEDSENPELVPQTPAVQSPAVAAIGTQAAPAPTTNGTNGTTVSAEDLDSLFMIFAEGKTDQEIKLGISRKEAPQEITDSTSYRMEIMTNKTTKRLMDSLKLVKDGEVYRINPEAV